MNSTIDKIATGQEFYFSGRGASAGATVAP